MKYLLTAAFLAAGVVCASELSTKPQPKPNGRIESRFKAANEKSFPIVFMGDSITHFWESRGKTVYDKYFAGMEILNLATSGDRTENTIWVIDQVNWQKVDAKVIMLMIGTNNTGHRPLTPKVEGGPCEKPEDTIEGIKVILEKLKEKSPNTKVLLLAIFPRAEKASDGQRVRNNQVNAVLPTLCDGKRVFWFDINSKFLGADGATMSREIMPDMLHPGEKGYVIWAEAVKDKLVELSK